METKDKIQENQNPTAQESESNNKPEQTREELAEVTRKLAQENKEFRQKLAETKKQSEAEKRKAMEEQGQFKELAEIEKSRAAHAEQQLTKFKEAVVLSRKADALALEAAKMGCVDTDAALALMDLSSVPIGDDLSVNSAHAKTLLEEFKKAKPYLFQKQAPRIPDATPSSPEKPKGLDLSKMNLAEKAALLSQLKNQGK